MNGGNTGGRIRGGLVSISFRKLSPRALTDLVARSGLEGLEWGGDIHVPHGDVACAREVATMTRNAGLTSCAYGSYYRLGVSEGEGLSFAQVLASARVLEAPTIRVWAGRGGSVTVSPGQRAAVVSDALRIADLAAREHCSISLEYHAKTLTDTAESVAGMMRDLQHPAIHFLWQPAPVRSADSHLAELRQVLPRLSNIHAYQWTLAENEIIRQSLEEGATVWPDYLSMVAGQGGEHWTLLEFVRNDDPEQFIRDAATLSRWLAAVQA